MAAAVALASALGVANAQHVGWPTPPPGEPFAVPSRSQIEQPITRSVERAGSQVAVVRPGWPGPLPLVPPVAADTGRFDGAGLNGPPLTIRIDAGTFTQVVQVRVSPAAVAGIDAGPSQALWAFDLEVFDAGGREVQAPPQRPLVVTIPVAAFVAAGVDPFRLSMAMLDGERLTPVVSTYRASDGTIAARLVEVAAVVLLRDQP